MTRACICSCLIVLAWTAICSNTQEKEKYLCTYGIIAVSKKDRNRQGKVWGSEYSFHVVLMKRQQQGKITFLMFPPHVCVLDEGPLECNWSRSKFYSISVNENKENHLIFLGIHPGVTRKTYASEGRPWKLLWNLLCLSKKMLTLLKLLWDVINNPVAPEIEVSLLPFFDLSWEGWCTSGWRAETTSDSSHWMLLGWKEEGKAE